MILSSGENHIVSVHHLVVNFIAQDFFNLARFSAHDLRQLRGVVIDKPFGYGFSVRPDDIHRLARLEIAFDIRYPRGEQASSV